MRRMELLNQMRRQSPSSHLPDSKDDEVDELLGLRMGADGTYIKKRFAGLRIERIRALRIRRGELGGADEAARRGR